MAAIAPAINDVSDKGDGSAMLVVWTPVTSAGSDTCNAVAFPEHTIKSVQAAGTFGGGTVAVNGSNDGANYLPLSTPANAAIGLTAAGVKALLENTRYIQPAISGGTAQSMTITMLFVRPTPPRT